MRHQQTHIAQNARRGSVRLHMLRFAARGACSHRTSSRSTRQQLRSNAGVGVGAFPSLR